MDRKRRQQTTLARRKWRHGSSLIEMVLAVPLLATVIGLTYFFGWAMTNQQHVRVSSRYAAWRNVRADESVSSDDLNVTFFEERSDSVSISDGTGPDETRLRLVEAAGEFDLALPLVEDTVLDRWPRGRSNQVAASFTSDIAFWQMFPGAIDASHAREGVEWRRGEVSYLEAIRDLFLHELDERVLSITDDTLRSNLRSLYMQRW